MIDKNLTLKYLYSIETDLIFEGHWKGQRFQAVFVSGEHEYGWHDMEIIGKVPKEDYGVFHTDHVDYDDIELALSNVTVEVDKIVTIA